jgi:uncharacterized sulfatase
MKIRKIKILDWKEMIEKTILVLGLIITIFLISCVKQIEPKPNILWITTEDISPHLGCYGEEYAYTPTLDKLAIEGIFFRNAYATASVCTPARSSIITGKYSSTLGTQHLRGQVPLSKNVKCFTEYLREAGYFCANFNKTDYNFEVPANAWDFNGKISYDSLVIGHIAKIPCDKPFFCVFNLSLTHQSQTRYGIEKLSEVNSRLPVEAWHDPNKAPIPPYYPKTPEVRINLAALHTQITKMDMCVKEILKQLDESCLSENTIVFFFSDHGDGLPKHKRWLHHSGTQVPFIVKFPQKFQHLSQIKPGEEVTSLINFIDLAPTMLAITGCDIPEMMPGKVFFGTNRQERKYTFAIRDRVDEVYEFSRSVSDGKYQYIRNFENNKPRMQWSNYSERTPIRKELRRLHKSGELDSQTGWLMLDTKPIEEFYDVENDPHQMNNLAIDPDYQERLKKMKNVLFDWMIVNHDLSLIPEPLMRIEAGDQSPMDLFVDNEMFPIEKILFMADLRGRGEVYLEDLITGLSDPSPAVRYWSAKGLSALEEKAIPACESLQSLLNDDFSIVRIAAAEALCKTGNSNDAINILGEALLEEDIVTRLYAAISILDLKSIPYHIRDKIYDSKKQEPKLIPDKHYITYLKNALQRIEMKI